MYLLLRKYCASDLAWQKLPPRGGPPINPNYYWGVNILLTLDLIPTRNGMISDQPTVAEMVDEILVRFETLDARRKYKFVEWLQVHRGRVENTVDICDGLTAWLESMQHENMQWEYRIIMHEIDWWGNLDEQSLSKIMLAEWARNGA